MSGAIRESRTVRIFLPGDSGDPARISQRVFGDDDDDDDDDDDARKKYTERVDAGTR